MYIRIVSKKYNVYFECTRVVEKEDSLTFLVGERGDIVHTEIMFDEGKQIRVYAVNENGKTVDSWHICPEGK